MRKSAVLYSLSPKPMEKCTVRTKSGNEQSVTIRDVARAAGVSAGTVSRALKNRYGMSEETRNKVIEVAQQLGYGLEQRRSRKLRRILFLLHRQHQGVHSNLFYSPVLHGAEDTCAEAGIALSFASVGSEAQAEEQIRMHEPDAIICAGYFEADVLKAVCRSSLPLVLVDHCMEGISSINDDNAAGGYAVVRHLLESGYKRIAFISGPPAHYSIRLREQGYRQALYDAAILTDPAYVAVYADGLDPAEASARCMDFLLDLPVRPDAVFAFNDLTALVAISRCQRRGLRVPEDIGVCGYDDIVSAATAHPALTTVSVDKEGLGREAVRQIQALTSGEVIPTSFFQPVRLVVRESSAGPFTRLREQVKRPLQSRQ